MNTSVSEQNRLLQNWENYFAIILALVALGFNGYQSIQTREAIELQNIALEAQQKSLNAQVWQMILEHQADLSKVFIDKPKLFPYFDRGKSITPEDENFDLVMAVADMYLDFFDAFHDEFVRSLPEMGPNGKYWALWKKYFQETFAQSPALCLRFYEVEGLYMSRLGQYAKVNCSNKPVFISNSSLKRAR